MITMKNPRTPRGPGRRFLTKQTVSVLAALLAALALTAANVNVGVSAVRGTLVGMDFAIQVITFVVFAIALYYRYGVEEDKW